ncbi:MAG: malto-oligosyltrehalose trehalohydrolase [Jannaschia sp.]
MTDLQDTDRHWGPLIGPDGVQFRLWAPGSETLSLHLNGTDYPMDKRDDGWFALTRSAEDGAEYGFRLPDGRLFNDPAGHAQMGNVHSLSRLTVPSHDWQHPPSPRPWEEAVIYECHIGTFTPEGTFRAAIDRLDHLVDLGVTALELMPVATFGGERGWGYDGTLLYAPHRAYGTPDDLRALVDAAHGRGLMLLLDVVYNHFGPEGSYLHALSPQFFDKERETPWGPAIDYAEAPVRRFFIDNAVYWLTEFRFDGLRLDAIDHIRDTSEPELLIQLARDVRARMDRPVHLTTEDNRNVTYLHERGEDGSIPLMTAEWNDDWHHCAHVIATGESEGYYVSFVEDPAGLLAKSAATGYSYQGETYEGGAARGVPSGHLPPAAFVDFLQNHDQVGNRAVGERIASLAAPDTIAALQTILLLSPHIPLLFMGEEWAETHPFLFFADFHDELGRAVTEGRRREFAGFMGHAASDVPDPIARATFEASKIDWSKMDTEIGRETYERVRTLLHLRAEHVVPHLAGTEPDCGTVLEAPKGCAAVDWRLNGAVLHLRANLSNAVCDLPPAGGEIVHLTGASEGAPCSAIFRISR